MLRNIQRNQPDIEFREQAIGQKLRLIHALGEHDVLRTVPKRRSNNGHRHEENGKRHNHFKQRNAANETAPDAAMRMDDSSP
ncbi:MAG: hypothetical protein AMXMBFR20_23390 [Planctomycetia bacterium]